MSALDPMSGPSTDKGRSNYIESRFNRPLVDRMAAENVLEGLDTFGEGMVLEKTQILHVPAFIRRIDSGFTTPNLKDLQIHSEFKQALSGNQRRGKSFESPSSPKMT